jgi:2-polyprenyl-3-methyl-5-hydroxy-6-metoxy-1,4-benzoquinol methylase/glycosyltransferase involved in cell wall biosynthesis
MTAQTETADTAAHPLGRTPRIGILVVAYNAASTLAKTLDRIPSEFRSRIQEVFVCDDASQDDTYLVGLGYQQITTDLPITVVRHEVNLGYGGNQKAGYQLAAEHDLDIIVLLHGDGQYAPELLPEIVAPLERGECDAVFGSRMMTKGAARKGGMPLYKYLGNRVLTTLENGALGSHLSEFHSGYRAYRVRALADLDLAESSDGFNFDTQIIIQLLDKGKRIVEIPIPTYYGDEICYVNGMRYAADILADVAAYRLASLGFTTGEACKMSEEYALKESEGSSHVEVLRLLAGAKPLRILDVGCSGGRLGEQLRERGHHVTGIDLVETPQTSKRVDAFFRADLEQGIPNEVGNDYDVVIAADVIEHLRNSDQLLRQIAERLRPDGRLLLSVPNFGHWYPRLRTVLGIFDYDQRGILDKTHVRFYTRRSLLKQVRKSGYQVQEMRVTGLPIDVLHSRPSPLRRVVLAVDSLLVRLRPTLFGYQFVLSLTPKPRPRSITFGRTGADQG